jgi:peptide/nickel transport system permease protein
MTRSAALAVGGAILAAVVLMGLAAPWIAPYPTTEQHMLDRLKPPGARFPLGTDQYGRDLLSRTLVGARPALVLGLGAVALGLALGVPIGLVAGYYRGWSTRCSRSRRCCWRC